MSYYGLDESFHKAFDSSAKMSSLQYRDHNIENYTRKVNAILWSSLLRSLLEKDQATLNELLSLLG